ncbi:MAG: hypothetical protein NZM38_09320 [Cytophagales bacterium]|nr:hypothetical protein [Cytophagales bacterium]MDW8384958.1 hypothetical protein [Flammeovirgaceae bacterium]
MEDLTFLAFLFHDNPVYVIKEETQKNATSTQFSISSTLPLQFYGTNKKNILIILEMRTPDFLKTLEFTLLDKILQAVHLTLNEVAIINLTENKSLTWEEIIQAFSPKKIILFGVSPFRLKLRTSFSPNKISFFQNITILATYTLTDLGQDRNKKIALWNALKQLFEIQ